MKARCGPSSSEDEVPTGGVQDVLRKPHDGWKAGRVTTVTGCVDINQVLTFVSPAAQAELWEEEMGAILVSVPPAKMSQYSSC